MDGFLLGLLEHLHLVLMVLSKPLASFYRWYVREHPDVLVFDDCENPWRDFVNEHALVPIPVDPGPSRIEFREIPGLEATYLRRFDDLLVVGVPVPSTSPDTAPATLSSNSW